MESWEKFSQPCLWKAIAPITLPMDPPLFIPTYVHVLLLFTWPALELPQVRLSSQGRTSWHRFCVFCMFILTLGQFFFICFLCFGVFSSFFLGLIVNTRASNCLEILVSKMTCYVMSGFKISSQWLLGDHINHNHLSDVWLLRTKPWISID